MRRVLISFIFIQAARIHLAEKLLRKRLRVQLASLHRRILDQKADLYSHYKAACQETPRSCRCTPSTYPFKEVREQGYAEHRCLA
jgi:hypothetical protein